VTRTTRSYTLDPTTVALLDSVGPRQASGYVDRTIQQRWQRWQESLATLAQSGWAGAEVLAACDALNGVWLGGAVNRAPDGVALELRDNSGAASRHGVAPERWTDLVRSVGESHAMTAALLEVILEFWAGNAACSSAIDRLTGGE